MATDATTQIDQALADPSSASNDGQSVTSRPISDQVLGLQYGAAVAKQSKPARGIVFSKLIPPGSVSDRGVTEV